MSLPSRERGLKYRVFIAEWKPFCVAPFAGAWIEILYTSFPFEDVVVAPFAGAWIEIISSGSGKFAEVVAPFAGAWIEIY